MFSYSAVQPGRACGSVKLRFVRGQPPKSITALMRWLDRSSLRMFKKLFNKGFHLIGCETQISQPTMGPTSWVPLLRQVRHKCHHPMPWLAVICNTSLQGALTTQTVVVHLKNHMAWGSSMLLHHFSQLPLQPCVIDLSWNVKHQPKGSAKAELFGHAW